ncbi:hypothetical protein ACSQ67_008568 [Phaseolus vulgaris]
MFVTVNPPPRPSTTDQLPSSLCYVHRVRTMNRLPSRYQLPHQHRVPHSPPTSSACRTSHVACCPSRRRGATNQLPPRHELAHRSRPVGLLSLPHQPCLRVALAAVASHALHRVPFPPPCVALVAITSGARFGKLPFPQLHCARRK